jgi:hypothetical protein
MVFMLVTFVQPIHFLCAHLYLTIYYIQVILSTVLSEGILAVCA